MSAKKTAYLGCALALSLAVTYLETLIPLNFGIYGLRLGLANIVVMLVIEYFGVKYALAVNIARAIIVNMLFGNFMSFVFSLCAGIVAIIAMRAAFYIPKIGIVGVSVIGSVAHNCTQTVLAALLLSGSLINLLPVMIAVAEITGIFTGIAARMFLNRIPATDKKTNLL